MPETIPIACSLEQTERPGRAALVAELGAKLEAVDAEGLNARLAFPATQRAALEEFTAAETECCPFFIFELAEAGDRIDLHIRASEGGDWAVRGLVAGFVAGWGGLL